MYSKIINPVTGRKVSIYGKLGKKILKNYLNNIIGGAIALPGNELYCIRDNVNCSNPLYPCLRDNKCFDSNNKFSINTNFDKENVKKECLKDNVNCSNPLYPCFKDDKCFDVDLKYSVSTNFDKKHVKEECIKGVEDNINCSNKLYPCFKDDNCYTMNGLYDAPSNFNF